MYKESNGILFRVQLYLCVSSFPLRSYLAAIIYIFNSSNVNIDFLQSDIGSNLRAVFNFFSLEASNHLL